MQGGVQLFPSDAFLHANTDPEVCSQPIEPYPLTEQDRYRDLPSAEEQAAAAAKEEKERAEREEEQEAAKRSTGVRLSLSLSR